MLPLVLVLKKFLAFIDLNTPFLGGLSSYGLILLLKALINTRTPYLFEPYKSDNISLSRTFAHFLYYYGHIFDTYSLMVDENT